jgi:hypothetical protein
MRTNLLFVGFVACALLGCDEYGYDGTGGSELYRTKGNDFDGSQEKHIPGSRHPGNPEPNYAP